MSRIPPAGAASVDVALPASTGPLVTGWPLRRYLLTMGLAVFLPLLAFAGVLICRPACDPGGAHAIGPATGRPVLRRRRTPPTHRVVL